MSIVLKENEWAQEMIRSNTLGNKPSETLRRVARLYLDQGFKPSDVKKKLEAFLIRCDPTSSIPKWTNSINRAVNTAKKYKAIDIDNIEITKPEMEKIDSLDGKQIKRLAFTLLCLAKYWMIVNQNDDYWVNNKDTEIASMANINTSIKRQSLMYWMLRESGMIQFSKKVDNTNVRVCFAEPGDVVLSITDFRNLGYQYLMYHGEPFFECANCGIVTKIKNPQSGRKQKYCSECASKISIQQKIDSVMRHKHEDIVKFSNSEDVYTVYMHQCPNGKAYVGTTTTTLHKRWKGGVGYITNKPFYSDIEKYGWDNIAHYKIASTQSRELAECVENYYIQEFNTTSKDKGYNRSDSGNLGGTNQNISDIFMPVQVDGKGSFLR